jgi:hypothetical protein
VYALDSLCYLGFPVLGATICVKLAILDFCKKNIIILGLPLTYAYAMLRQSVAGNSPFRGIIFCNLGTPKTVISKIVTTWQIETPYSSPCKYDHPNDVPVGQKSISHKKSLPQKCINSFLAHKLSHDRWLWFFGGGAYGSLPDAMVPADWGWGRSNKIAWSFVFC